MNFSVRDFDENEERLRKLTAMLCLRPSLLTLDMNSRPFTMRNIAQWRVKAELSLVRHRARLDVLVNENTKLRIRFGYPKKYNQD